MSELFAHVEIYVVTDPKFVALIAALRGKVPAGAEEAVAGWRLRRLWQVDLFHAHDGV